MRKFLLGLLALALSTPLQAEWHEASSDHFLIYSDSRAEDVREFATILERFHSAMALKTGRETEVPSPSNRVTIFAVGSGRNVRELYGNRYSNVAGFYIPRAGSTVAFVPNIRLYDRDDFNLTVLLHEYAHHFLISSSTHGMPRWLSEGAAEFFASAKFGRDGSVDIGLPNNNRAYEIANARDVPIRALLDHDIYMQRASSTYDAFYGRSWALFHYLAFDQARSGQLAQYWRAVAAGMPSLEAAAAVFGNLDALQEDLDSYVRKRRMSGTRYPASEISSGEVQVRQLGQGEAEMMPVILRSRRGVDSKEAAEILPQAREVAARYPADAAVQAALSEAENDAGNREEAVAAADKALKIDPTSKHALVQKGRALFALAGDADNPRKAYAVAMAPFQSLNRLEPDHPLPLIHYYRAEAADGGTPSEPARHALERASQLAPFDHNLALQAALMQAAEGKPLIAAATLVPVASDPHGGGRAEAAKKIIEQLRSAKEGESLRIDIRNPDDDAEEGDG